MAELSQSAPQRFRLADLQIDMRLVGMLAILGLIWVGFGAWTGGLFLTPRNVFNVSVQTASVAVMATGMVFVIVTRHIDLSVGSLLGFLGMVMAVMQARWLANGVEIPLIGELPGLGFGHPAIPWITLAVGVALGALIGAFQGWIIGFLTVPAFIVTLGGFLVWRGAAWWVTTGQTVAPLDPTFSLIGGGAEGTLGLYWSWVFAIVASLGAIAIVLAGRRRKLSHNMAVKPAWAEALTAAIFAGAILGYALITASYKMTERASARVAESRGQELAEGEVLAFGIPYPILVLAIIAIGMTIIAKRTRFGRYIFATGGNPEATELSGVDTRMLTVKVFALMGALVAIAAAIASARLNSAGNDLGTLDELRVIAAAVIGGTALAGGVGTIHGAIIGAFIMQSLQSGMAMARVDAPLQNIVVGVVLVLAVLLDKLYRRRMGE